MNEIFQPKPVTRGNPILFRLRCCIDLQLWTIFSCLKHEIPALKGKILDVGAGESPWRELLSHDADYYGLDVAHSSSFKMSNVRSDITYYEGTIFPFPNETFSSAFCIETLEHVSNPENMLREIFRVLGGVGQF